MSNESLQQQFEEDSPQQVNKLEGIRSLSNYVVRLQSLEDEVKIMEENLKKKKEAADKISQQVFSKVESSSYSFFFESLFILHNERIRIKEIPIVDIIY